MTLRDLNQLDRMPSPTKPEPESQTQSPLGPLPPAMQLHPPPSPGSHRTLRRLQSAHSLGAKAAAQPSLISQQRLQLQQRQQQIQQHQLQHQQQPQPQFQNLNQHLQRLPPPLAPQPRRHASTNRSPQRGRANSDAPPIPNAAQFNPAAMTAATTTRRSALSKRSLAADAMSLERLLRDGPPDGDVEGALESTRLKILDQGIRSDGDGMVSNPRLSLGSRSPQISSSLTRKHSRPSASMCGSSYSMPPCSRPIPTWP